LLKETNTGGSVMKVHEGDVLICGTEDCKVELTVTKECVANSCDDACDIEATCCEEPMQLKNKNLAA
jgi:hypothetical protein